MRGSNVVVANKSWSGFPTRTCLTVHDAKNVYIHDVDFDGCGGDIFLVNVTGVVRIENVRARNTGDGSIGAGHGNVIQFNNVWQSAPELPDGSARIRMIKSYGGDTEDVISMFRSGGIDAAHPLVIGSVHIEDPLTGPLAWSSPSSTCVNLADAGGHDIRLQNSSFLNCGAIGIQMNEPGRNVKVFRNVVYGQARPTSNVGSEPMVSGSLPLGVPRQRVHEQPRVVGEVERRRQPDVALPQLPGRRCAERQAVHVDQGGESPRRALTRGMLTR